MRGSSVSAKFGPLPGLPWITGNPTANTRDTKGVALTPAEVKSFLDAAKAVNPDYYLLFLTALRAGLRRGELVALRWGGSDVV